MAAIAAGAVAAGAVAAGAVAVAETGEETSSQARAEAETDAAQQPESAEQTAQTVTTVGDIDIDPEIVEIFVEEVDQVLEAIQEAMPQWGSDLSDQEPLGEIRRGFHTLKGSGRIVGANQIGELAWSVENMLNRVMDGTITANDDHHQLVDRVTAQIPDLKADFADGKVAVRPLVHDLMEAADVLSSGGSLSQALTEAEDDSQAEEEQSAESLFAEEAVEHLAVLEDSIGRSVANDELVLEPEFMRGLHTISGSAATVGQTELSEVAGTLETLCGAVIRERDGKLDGEYLGFFSEGVKTMGQF